MYVLYDAYIVQMFEINTYWNVCARVSIGHTSTHHFAYGTVEAVYFAL